MTLQDEDTEEEADVPGLEILEEVEVFRPDQIGFHPAVLLSSLFKRIVEAHAGRGGVEALCEYLDKIDWVEGLSDLGQVIKENSIFFETALGGCTKEQLKRPRMFREEDACEFLGSLCKSCGLTVTSLIQRRCPNCGQRLKILYVENMLDMMNHRGMLAVTPEAVMMDISYDRLGEAFVAEYKALRLVTSMVANLFGWEQFIISDPSLRNYLDEYFLGRLVGETKIPREEKQILQFMARGCLADIEVDEAEKLIKLGITVVKYGYIFQVLRVIGALRHYRSALNEYTRLYNTMNQKIREELVRRYGQPRQPTISVASGSGRGYAPCFVMPKDAWNTGVISKDIMLEPVYRMPVFTKADFGALQTIYGPTGSGKTVLLSSIVCHAIRRRREMIFTPLGDKSNSFTLACMPMFAYSGNTSRLLDILEDLVGVEPQGVPVLSLTFLRKGEVIRNVSKHPPTIYDRLAIVEDPQNFKFDFRAAVRELRRIAREYGYNRPTGVIAVRNLLEERFDRDANVSADVQIATNMLGEFDEWRKGDLSIPARVFIDEVAALARSKISLYAKDILRSGETILDFIREGRRDRVSIDMATQMPLEILPNIRDAARNVFFRDLASSYDKRRSQIVFLVGSLQLRDPALRTVVTDINNRQLLGPNFWFWFHRPSRDINIVKPSPPTFCVQDPDAGMSNQQIFRRYEKETGKEILLKRWDEVPHLETKHVRKRVPLT